MVVECSIMNGLRDALDDFDQIGHHAHGCDCAAGPSCVR